MFCLLLLLLFFGGGGGGGREKAELAGNEGDIC